MVKTSLADLLRLALELPPGDRLTLATELLKSVEGAEDQDWTDAWVRELDRRTAAVDRGDEPLESWETVETNIRARLP
jgi:putative addiction module component (TIGR02574 family)